MYWRRNLTLARALMVFTVCVIVFSFISMSLMPWNSTFALQRLRPGASGRHRAIVLRNTRTCFPAAMRSQQSTDVAFVAARNGARLWDEEGLRNSGPNSIAFLTAIEPRGSSARLAREAQLRASGLFCWRRAARIASARQPHHRQSRRGADTCLDVAGEHTAEVAGRAAPATADVFVLTS